MKLLGLKQTYTKKGLKQNWLAKQMGVSTRTIYRWQIGDISPREKSIEKLQSLLHCSREELKGSESKE